MVKPVPRRTTHRPPALLPGTPREARHDGTPGSRRRVKRGIIAHPQVLPEPNHDGRVGVVGVDSFATGSLPDSFWIPSRLFLGRPRVAVRAVIRRSESVVAGGVGLGSLPRLASSAGAPGLLLPRDDGANPDGTPLGTPRVPLLPPRRGGRDARGEPRDRRAAHRARRRRRRGSVFSDGVEGRVREPPQLEAPAAQRVRARDALHGDARVEADGAAVLVVLVREQFAHDVV